ncbi:hypothetical protein [Candidatus Ferrigenium straubiae]|uniref:hypothetical protein n=1 Tax=Candidatus Ferrigenium straubiae TaxID=2919506 RepID=UPI003F4AC127
MSLLLDARKKSLQATQPGTGTGTETATPQAADQTRSTRQKLFTAKSLFPIPGGALPNRNLLYALGGTILLLVGGMIYLWYLDSTSHTTPPRPISAPPAPPAHQTPPTAATEPAIPHEPTAAGNGPTPAAPPPEQNGSLPLHRQRALPPPSRNRASAPRRARSPSASSRRKSSRSMHCSATPISPMAMAGWTKPGGCT